MKTFLILGGGTGGTMVANKMSHHLDPAEWKIIVVDENENHYYQPGLLFIPFGIYSPADVVKPKRDFYPQNVEFVLSKIEMIEPDQNRVKLEKGKRMITYDTLVIATGSRIAPDETPGLLENGWHKNIFDFYTIEGATALSRFLKFWKGGQLVLNVAEMPIKCPVAPLEFLFLADWFFHERGIRDDVEIISPPRCREPSPNLELRRFWAICSKPRTSKLKPTSTLWKWITLRKRSVPTMRARSLSTSSLVFLPIWALR